MDVSLEGLSEPRSRDFSDVPSDTFLTNLYRGGERHVPDKKTLLLLPWGGGNGHFTHCAAVGKAAGDRGWRVVVALTDNPVHRSLACSLGFEAIRYPRGLDTKNSWECWLDEHYFEAAVDADVDMIQQVGASLVVHDIRLSTPVAALVCDKEPVVIAHSPVLEGFDYPGLPTPPLWRGAVRSANRTIGKLGQPLIAEDVRELLSRGPVLIPSVPEFDEVPEAFSGSAVYVGPLSLSKGTREADTAAGQDNFFFYRTVGTGESFRAFRSVFSDYGKRVLIGTGSEESARSLQTQCAETKFRIQAMWDFEEIAPQTKVAVHHGGPGTVFDCIKNGLPSIALPGDNPERGLYAGKLDKYGLGVSLSSEAKVDTEWGKAIDSTGEVPPWSEVREHIERLASDANLGPQIKQWSARLDNFSVDQALDLLTVI
ncbi:glycosyltransferase [Streptomyces sp. NPDC002550]